METTVRLRLALDNTILSKTQKAEGLRRCWLLLKPQLHQTIYDLSSYLLNTFHLHDACRSGLLLSMEGFVLPPFESTSIFRDKDIIRVKRKESEMGTEVIELNEGVENMFDVVEIVNQPPVATTGVKLLANEEFGKEFRGYESDAEEEEDGEGSAEGRKEGSMALCVENAPEGTAMISKKRKASKELRGTRKKKKKPDDVQNGVVVLEDLENDSGREQNGNLSSVKVDERSNKKHKAATSTKKSSQIQEHGNGSVDDNCNMKLPSRSVRRKKAKKRWLREQLKAQQEEQQQSQVLEQVGWKSSGNNNGKVSKEFLEKNNHKASEEMADYSNEPKECHQQLNESSDTDDDLVPVVIRPGHIRFQPLQKGSDQAVQDSRVPVETFQWNGTMNKKKGQKWGKEKAAYCKRSDHKNFNQDHSEVQTVSDYKNFNQNHSEVQTMSDHKAFNQDHSKATTSGAEKANYDSIDFDELMYYTSLPKEGDVIAYRLIELSSSWTPELSSYRVGKISRYNLESNRIMLMPVPECPIPKKTGDEGSAVQAETFPYGEDYREDGSLEVNYSSLVEVRLVDHGNGNSAKSVPSGSLKPDNHNGNSVNYSSLVEVPAREEDAGPSLKPDNHDGTGSSAQCPTSSENVELNAWEEIDHTLKLKKAQVLQEDDRSKPENSRKRTWSRKALRGSALGPALALLRTENEL